MFESRKVIYILVVLSLTGLGLTFRPGMWLVHKPANTENPVYAKGWEDGCISGSNSYSLLYAPLLDKPFIKEIDVGDKKADAAASPADKGNATSAKDMYRSAWNEGFTMCRYYQSSVYELMQFAIVIATLLFIGYLLARKPVE